MASPVTKTWRKGKKKHLKLGRLTWVVIVATNGHRQCNRSLEMTHHFLFCTVSAIQRVRPIFVDVRNFPYSTYIWHPSWSTIGISTRPLASENYSPGYPDASVAWLVFSSVDRTLACDGQTDIHRTIASTTLAWRRAVKMEFLPLWHLCYGLRLFY